MAERWPGAAHTQASSFGPGFFVFHVLVILLVALVYHIPRRKRTAKSPPAATMPVTLTSLAVPTSSESTPPEATPVEPSPPPPEPEPVTPVEPSPPPPVEPVPPPTGNPSDAPEPPPPIDIDARLNRLHESIALDAVDSESSESYRADLLEGYYADVHRKIYGVWL